MGGSQGAVHAGGQYRVLTCELTTRLGADCHHYDRVEVFEPGGLSIVRNVGGPSHILPAHSLEIRVHLCGLRLTVSRRCCGISEEDGLHS